MAHMGRVLDESIPDLLHPIQITTENPREIGLFTHPSAPVFFGFVIGSVCIEKFIQIVFSNSHDAPEVMGYKFAGLDRPPDCAGAYAKTIRNFRDGEEPRTSVTGGHYPLP
jgi:hypothetical protein